MKLLRDENGYVLVMRRPSLLVTGKTAEEESSAIQPVQADRKVEAPVCSVPHCCFYCAWCGQPILLPNDRIGSPFGHPDARKIDVRSIAAVCHNCKHIGNYSMFRACRGFDTRHKIMHSPIKGQTVLLHWLQCIERTCPDRVPLFATLDGDTPTGEAEAGEWLWAELTCASGHPIRKIQVDPAFPLPLRSPVGSR
ncbi:MAG: hypothetical protein WCA10_17705 [Terracidiphilus sp.]